MIHDGGAGAYEACSYSWPTDRWTCKAHLESELWAKDFGTSTTTYVLQTADQWGRDTAHDVYVTAAITACYLAIDAGDAQEIANNCTEVTP